MVFLLGFGISKQILLTHPYISMNHKRCNVVVLVDSMFLSSMFIQSKKNVGYLVTVWLISSRFTETDTGRMLVRPSGSVQASYV